MRPSLLIALLLAAAGAVAVLLWDRAGRPLPGRGDVAAAEMAPAPVVAPLGDPPPGWVELVLGAPSGVGQERRPEPPAAPVAPVEPQPEVLQDSELVVRPGQVLSKILAEHYGPGSARWLGVVARYNGLDDPDELQAGSVLRLPDVSRLVAAELESSP